MRAIKLEYLLIVAVLSLVGQLAWPGVAKWWRKPSPGRQGVEQLTPIAGLSKEFLVRLPERYGGKPWPLVVFLHGAAERGHDVDVLRDRGPMMLTLPAIVVAPQCLSGTSWEPGAVAQFVEQVASQYQVDRERVYLIGYSMGGYGTWRTAAAHPNLFAAVVPICGGGEPGDAQSLAKIPLWAFHGADDQVVPLQESTRMIDAIRNAGGDPKFTVLSEAGHGICEVVCSRSDLWEWLFQQKREEEVNDRD